MLISYKLGQGSIILRVKILDSAATTGAGKTGLTSASSGLIISTIANNEATATAYTVAGGLIETIATLGTYAAPTSGKCRFKEVDATNHKGVYEIHIADARFAVSSAKSILVSISGATDAAECDALIPLVQLDPYEAMRGTDGANTTAPDNTQGAAVITALGNGTVVLHEDYDPAKDAVSQSQITGGGYSLDTDANGRIRVVDGTGVGEISLTSGLIDGITGTITTFDGLDTAQDTQHSATQSAIAALNFATPTNVTDAQAAIIAQVDANEVKIDNIQTSINTIDGIVDNILIDTNELQTDWANGGRLDSIIDLILADTGTDGIVISSTTANQIADAILTRDWTLVSGEAARSALNALRILRNKVSESGGTLTITEEDDSTTAWTASVTTSVSANPITIIDPS